MLRASSEIAVATSVASLAEKPSCSAKMRPCRRAVTTSMSAATATVTSSSGLTAPLFISGFAFEVAEALLEIQRRRDLFQGDAQLNHRESDFGLDADNDGFRA